MTYELAKQLKDAGFPIPDCPAWIINGDGPMGAVIWKDKYIPTLSELIEACGDEWIKVYNLENNHAHWVADRVFPHTHGHGSTPEEAVSNLWLALNRK